MIQGRVADQHLNELTLSIKTTCISTDKYGHDDLRKNKKPERRDKAEYTV